MSIFTKVAINKPRFNTFDLSHSRKFAMAFGQLYPCFLAETVPNDTFRLSTSHLVRMAPMIAPLMHEVSVYMHYFYVPNRILWKGWENFINGGADGQQGTAFPIIKLSGITQSSLGESLGLPEWTGTERSVSAIIFGAYQKVWYEYYRDQNLSLPISWLEPDGTGLLDGDNQQYLGDLLADRQRAWQHDYFTSALPWTQRGPEATIPLGSTAPIIWDTTGQTGSSTIETQDGSNWIAGYGNLVHQNTGTSRVAIFGDQGGGTYKGGRIDSSKFYKADLSNATASAINDLRRAFRLQEWLELNSRAGARYNEAIKAHFGIDPGDARIQRPVFIGGTRTPIVISEVLQTSETQSSGGNTPQGNMAGHGVSVGGKNVFNYKCREHGFIIGIMSIMPKSAYQQGIPKHWFKFDKFDYFWRQFANIGEQAILNKELYVDSTTAEDDNTFGYTPRYAEYKYIPSTVHGAFKNSLDFWHLGRKFATRPTLNETFVTLQRTELNRVFAVSGLSEEQFYVMTMHRVKARRPMPYFGTPSM